MAAWVASGLLAGTLGLFLGGCGGSGESDAADAATGYLEAVLDGDGEAACERLTAEARGVVADFAATQLPELGTIDCAEVLGQLAQFTPDEALDAARETVDAIGEEDIEISGDLATLDLPGATVPLELEEDAGEWRVTAETLKRSLLVNYVPSMY